MAKAQGAPAGSVAAMKKPPVSYRNSVSASEAEELHDISVRKAPMRRDEKRAEKSATPQPSAADIPRRMSKGH